jgi:hypothetical protein
VLAPEVESCEVRARRLVDAIGELGDECNIATAAHLRRGQECLSWLQLKLQHVTRKSWCRRFRRVILVNELSLVPRDANDGGYPFAEQEFADLTAPAE